MNVPGEESIEIIPEDTMDTCSIQASNTEKVNKRKKQDPLVQSFSSAKWWEESDKPPTQGDYNRTIHRLGTINSLEWLMKNAIIPDCCRY